MYPEQITFMAPKHRVFVAMQLSAIATALVFFGLWRFTDWLPSPGVSVAIIAFIAAAMSIHGEMSGYHKAFWMVIIGAFLVLELLAIRHADVEQAKRQKEVLDEERQHFSDIADGIKGAIAQSQQQFDATMKKTKILLDTTQTVNVLTERNLTNITGGSSFAYIRPQVEGAGKGPIGLVVWNHGNEILTGVTIAISRTNDPSWGSEFYNRYQVGTIAPHDSAMIPVTITPNIGTSGRDHYWAMISAQNGTVDETIDFKESKKSPGNWAVMIRVSERIRINQQTTAFPLVILRGWSDEPDSEQKLPSIRTQLGMFKRTAQQQKTKRHGVKAQPK